MKKTCTQCHRSKDMDDFCKWSKSKDGRNPHCRLCWSARNAAYRAANASQIRKTNKAWRAKNAVRWEESRTAWRLRIKTEVMTHYSKGTPRCACCYIRHIVFLAIDHIKGGGFKHRKSIKIMGGQGFYIWLKKRGYPDGYRVLCHNCNHATHVMGICPHELFRQVMWA